MPPKDSDAKGKAKATAPRRLSERIAKANATAIEDDNDTTGSMATGDSAPVANSESMTDPDEPDPPSQPGSSTKVDRELRPRSRAANHPQPSGSADGEEGSDKPDPDLDDASEYEEEEEEEEEEERSKRRKGTSSKKAAITKRGGKKKKEKKKKTTGTYWKVVYIERERINKGVKQYKARWASTWVDVNGDNINEALERDWQEQKSTAGKVVELKNGELVLAAKLMEDDLKIGVVSSAEAVGHAAEHPPSEEDENDTTAHEAEEENDTTALEEEEEDGNNPHLDDYQPGPGLEEELAYDSPAEIPDMEQESVRLTLDDARGMGLTKWEELTEPLGRIGEILTVTGQAIDWFNTFKRYILPELEFFLYAVPRSSGGFQRHGPAGQIIFPHHEHKHKDRWALWMSDMQDIPSAFRTELDNPNPAPEQEVILTIIPNPRKDYDVSFGWPVHCGSLNIRGFDKLLALEPDSEQLKDTLQNLMDMLYTALTSQVRICPYYEVRNTNDMEVIPSKRTWGARSASDPWKGLKGAYYFQAVEARINPEGDIERYQSNPPFKQAVRIRPATQSQSSDAGDSDAGDETAEGGGNATPAAAAGEYGEPDAEAMHLDKSDDNDPIQGGREAITEGEYTFASIQNRLLAFHETAQLAKQLPNTVYLGSSNGKCGPSSGGSTMGTSTEAQPVLKGSDQAIHDAEQRNPTMRSESSLDVDIGSPRLRDTEQSAWEAPTNTSAQPTPSNGKGKGKEPAHAPGTTVASPRPVPSSSAAPNQTVAGPGTPAAGSSTTNEGMSASRRNPIIPTSDKELGIYYIDRTL